MKHKMNKKIKIFQPPTNCSGDRETPVDSPGPKPNHTTSKGLDAFLLVLNEEGKTKTGYFLSKFWC